MSMQGVGDTAILASSIPGHLLFFEGVSFIWEKLKNVRYDLTEENSVYYTMNHCTAFTEFFKFRIVHIAD